MATYKQIPRSSALHPRFKTPWLSILLFAGVAPILVILPGDVDLVGDAVLVRRDPVVHRRARVADPDAHATGDGGDPLLRARPNLRFRRHRLAPVRRSSAGWPPGISFRVILASRIRPRAGSARLDRRRLRRLRGLPAPVVAAPLHAHDKAPPAYGPALALEYQPAARAGAAGSASDRRLDVAASLAAERGSQDHHGRHVLEVPLDLPARDRASRPEQIANRELDEARAIGDSYGVDVIPRLPRVTPAPRSFGGERRAARSSSSARRERTSAGASGGLRQDRRLRAQERALPCDRDRLDGGA